MASPRRLTLMSLVSCRCHSTVIFTYDIVFFPNNKCILNIKKLALSKPNGVHFGVF